MADAVERNVDLVTQQLAARSAIIASQITSHDLAVVGAVYHLKTGQVELQR